MINGDQYRDELKSRIGSVLRLLEATHPTGVDNPVAGREARGLAILLLFASYENLLDSLCRGILEEAKRATPSNSRLPNHLKVFAVYSEVKALAEVIDHKNETKKWERTAALIAAILNKNACTIDPNVFPKDGSYMKSTQISLFFLVFELGHPADVLKEVWGRLDTIVSERNAIAHGRKTPEEVGRGYSIEEVTALTNLWMNKWICVIDHIESRVTDSYFTG